MKNKNKVKNPFVWSGLIFFGALGLHQWNQSPVATPANLSLKPDVSREATKTEIEVGPVEEKMDRSGMKASAAVPETLKVSAPEKSDATEVGWIKSFLSRPIASRSPSILKLKQEIRTAPHSRPPSYLNFAMEITSAVEVSLKSPKTAGTMFARLRECVSTDPETISGLVRRHCLRESQRMSAARPELRPAFRELAAQLSPYDRQFLRSMGRMRVYGDQS